MDIIIGDFINKSRRTLLLVLVLTVISITIAAWSFATLYSEPIQKQQVSNSASAGTAKIVAISPRQHWGNPVGMTMDFWFKVSIRNDNNKAIEGLTLNLTITNASTAIYQWNTYEPIGTIQPDETSEVQVYILVPFDYFDQLAGHEAVVQLISGDKIIDESCLVLSTKAWGWD